MGNSQSSEGGFRIYFVAPNSPADRAGLEPFFDYILAANGNEIAGHVSAFTKLIVENENKEITFHVLSKRDNQMRNVCVIPCKWEGDGLLGANVKFDSLETNCCGLKVLNILPNTPAASSNIRPNEDWILGTRDIFFADPKDFSNYLNQKNESQIELYVYSIVTRNVRVEKIVLYQGAPPTGRVTVGLDLATGAIHGIPYQYLSKQLTANDTTQKSDDDNIVFVGTAKTIPSTNGYYASNPIMEQLPGAIEQGAVPSSFSQTSPFGMQQDMVNQRYLESQQASERSAIDHYQMQQNEMIRLQQQQYEMEKMKQEQELLLKKQNSFKSPMDVAAEASHTVYSPGSDTQALRQKEEAIRQQEMLRVQQQDSLRRQQEDAAQQQEALRLQHEEQLRRQHEEELRRQHEEELRKHHEEEMRKQHEEELRRQHEEEMRRQHEEELRKHHEEEMRKQHEEELRKHHEEEMRKQHEEEMRRQHEEELRKQHEEELRRQHEEELHKQHEEELRRQHEEELRKQHEEELRKQHEEELRRQHEEELRKQQEEKLRRQHEEELIRQSEEKRRREQEEELRKKEEENSFKQQEEQRRQQEEEARRRHEEEVKKQKEEELRRQHEEEMRRQHEEELRRHHEEEMRRQHEEELRRRQQEEETHKQEEEDLHRHEEELRIQQEEEMRRQHDAILRQNEERLRMQQEEELRKKHEEDLPRQQEEHFSKQEGREIQNHAEDALRRQNEEELRLQSEEELHKQHEEELRRQHEEELRRQQEERQEYEDMLNRRRIEQEQERVQYQQNLPSHQHEKVMQPEIEKHYPQKQINENPAYQYGTQHQQPISYKTHDQQSSGFVNASDQPPHSILDENNRQGTEQIRLQQQEELFRIQKEEELMRKMQEERAMHQQQEEDFHRMEELEQLSKRTQDSHKHHESYQFHNVNPSAQSTSFSHFPPQQSSSQATHSYAPPAAEFNAWNASPNFDNTVKNREDSQSHISSHNDQSAAFANMTSSLQNNPQFSPMQFQQDLTPISNPLASPATLYTDYPAQAQDSKYTQPVILSRDSQQAQPFVSGGTEMDQALQRHSANTLSSVPMNPQNAAAHSLATPTATLSGQMEVNKENGEHQSTEAIESAFSTTGYFNYFMQSQYEEMQRLKQGNAPQGGNSQTARNIAAEIPTPSQASPAQHCVFIVESNPVSKD